MCSWFDFWFRRCIYCLLVYIVCFPTYHFSSLFYLFSPLLVFSFENRPILCWVGRKTTTQSVCDCEFVCLCFSIMGPVEVCQYHCRITAAAACTGLCPCFISSSLSHLNDPQTICRILFCLQEQSSENVCSLSLARQLGTHTVVWQSQTHRH